MNSQRAFGLFGSTVDRSERSGEPKPSQPQREPNTVSEVRLTVLPLAPCEYTKSAEYLLETTPEDCHPALYARRFEIAQALYKAADDPLSTESRRLIAGVAFLCYRLRSNFT